MKLRSRLKMGDMTPLYHLHSMLYVHLFVMVISKPNVTICHSSQVCHRHIYICLHHKNSVSPTWNRLTSVCPDCRSTRAYQSHTPLLLEAERHEQCLTESCLCQQSVRLVVVVFITACAQPANSTRVITCCTSSQSCFDHQKSLSPQSVSLWSSHSGSSPHRVSRIMLVTVTLATVGLLHPWSK